MYSYSTPITSNSVPTLEKKTARQLQRPASEWHLGKYFIVRMEWRINTLCVCVCVCVCVCAQNAEIFSECVTFF